MAILIVALALRLGFFAVGPGQDLDRALQPDSPRYLELGRNIAESGTFALPVEPDGSMHATVQQLRRQRGELEPVDSLGLVPETMRSPGYPWFIATINWLGGQTRALLVTQCILSAWSVVLVYALAWRLIKRRSLALIPAAVVAANPADILAANAVLTESVFTVALLGALVLVTLSYRPAWKLNLILVATAGLMLGVAALIRPVGIFLAPAVVLWWIVTQPRWRTVTLSVVLLCGAALPIAGWSSRNARIGLGSRISHIDSFQNFAKTSVFIEMALQNKHQYPKDWTPLYEQEMRELHASLQPDETVFAGMNRLAMAKIKAHPTTYAAVLADNMVKFFTDHSQPYLHAALGGEYQSTGLRDALLMRGSGAATGDRAPTMLACLAWSGFNAVLLALACVGLVRLTLQRRMAAALLIAGMLFYFAFATQAHGLERMRVPVLGLQAIAAAAIMLPRRAARPHPMSRSEPRVTLAPSTRPRLA